MKNFLLAALLLAALGAVFNSTAAGARQKVGGYKEAATDDPEVTSAADFAVAAEGRKENMTIKLVSVEAAERQTVAGTNFRLCLKVETEDTDNNVDATETVKVLVFKSLQKAYTLKSWEKEDCASGDDNGN
ncbi:MAG TPA: cystatin domain-containing protein [Pyrinomonadaceae bacterium]|nr:cystatin domain-containing protein [Pyrinomonadaceae bacterium]